MEHSRTHLESDRAKLPISYWEFIVLNGLLFGQNAMALDVFLPVLPLITSEFGLSNPNDVQQVFTICFYGFALSQLIYAPLSDSLGRRSMLLLACGIMFLGGLGVLFASTFSVLLAARFLQGLGMGAGRTVNLSALRDLFDGRELGKAMSNMYFVFSFVPVVAPLLGLALVAYGWRAAAAVPLVLSAVIGIWVWKSYPETLPKEKRKPLSLLGMAKDFGTVLKTTLTVVYAVSAGFTFSAILQILLLMTPIGSEIYGIWWLGPVVLAILALVMAFVSRSSAIWVMRIGMRGVGHGVLIFMLTWSIIFLACLALCWLNVWVFSILMIFIGGPLAGVLANIQAIALGPHDKIAGVAASVSGATMTIVGTVIASHFAAQYDGTLWPLAKGLIVGLTGSLILVLIMERGRLFKATAA